MAVFGFNKDDKEVRRKNRTDVRLERQANRRTWFKNRQARRGVFDYSVGIVAIVAIILLFVALVAELRGENIVTFKGLLEFLQTCPSFDLDLLALPQIPTVNWGVFQVLAGLINGVIFLINALTFILMAIVNSLAIFVWFLKFVFL